MFSRSLVTVFGALLLASSPAFSESNAQLEEEARTSSSSPIDAPHPMAMAHGGGPKIVPCLRVGAQWRKAHRQQIEAAEKAAEKK